MPPVQFETGPDQVVVELHPGAASTPSNLPAFGAPGAAFTGFALSGVDALVFAPLFHVGPVAEFAHVTAPTAFALPSSPPNTTASQTEELSRFLVANVPRGFDPRPTIERLNGDPSVAVAYHAPAAVPALWEAPVILEGPAATPNYVPLQGYLGPAPGGVDALYAWTLPGANGQGVTICDVEGGWTLNHEDLTAAGIRLLHGNISSDPGWLNHGTAVLGEMLAVPNGQGGQGIAFASRGRVVCIFPSNNPAEAVRAAADTLEPGDVLLIELHRPGPRSGASLGQFGYLPMEFWRACATLRDWLRTTGSHQTDGPNGPIAQRIGNRPDLRALLAKV